MVELPVKTGLSEPDVIEKLNTCKSVEEVEKYFRNALQGKTRETLRIKFRDSGQPRPNRYLYKVEGRKIEKIKKMQITKAGNIPIVEKSYQFQNYFKGTLAFIDSCSVQLALDSQTYDASNLQWMLTLNNGAIRYVNFTAKEGIVSLKLKDLPIADSLIGTCKIINKKNPTRTLANFSFYFLTAEEKKSLILTAKDAYKFSGTNLETATLDVCSEIFHNFGLANPILVKEFLKKNLSKE